MLSIFYNSRILFGVFWAFLHVLKVMRKYAYEASSVIELELLISTTLELINNSTDIIICYPILGIWFWHLYQVAKTARQKHTTNRTY